MTKPENNYLTVNKDSWNKRTLVHLDSIFYDNESFIIGRSSLNSIELNYLKNIEDKSVLHLQCHFGQDSISLKRLGAARVLGLDFSDVAIEKAVALAATCQEEVDFICTDVYDFPAKRVELFDLIFSSYGTIGWLPDIDRWASVVAGSLKKGGEFVFAEFHPYIWMFDDNFEKIQYRYFNDKAIIETEGTYTDGQGDLQTNNISWNHSLSDVISALIKHGMALKELKEYDYSPYDCFPSMNEVEKGKFQFAKYGNKMPMVYSLYMEKVRD